MELKLDGFSMFPVDSSKAMEDLGSATVPVAVGRVSRPTSLPIRSRGLFFALAAFKKQAGRNVFGGTPNTACETHALPGIAIAGSNPLKMSKKQLEQSPRLHYCVNHECQLG